ncbi:hypothetical protein ACU8KH_05697 [Lachancea thermotolerans]
MEEEQACMKQEIAHEALSLRILAALFQIRNSKRGSTFKQRMSITRLSSFIKDPAFSGLAIKGLGKEGEAKK